MKIEKIAEIIKKFDEGDITEEEAIKELEGAEPFDFYTATVELYLEDEYQIKQDNFPMINKLLKGLYEEDFSKLIDGLEKDHPIKRLMIDHKKFDTVLGILDDIKREIEEGTIQETNEVMKIEIAAEALTHIEEHIRKEEKLIFPVWYQMKGFDSKGSFLLEEEHRYMMKSHKRLLKKANQKKDQWKKEDWKELSDLIDALVEEIRFHTFHEGKMFYPILLGESSRKNFDDIKKKMDRLKSNKTPIDNYIKRLNLPILHKRNIERR